VKANGGAPNKNIGDAFLLVWVEDQQPDTKIKRKPEHLLQQEEEERRKISDREDEDGDSGYMMCGDGCLRAFCRVVIECNQSTEIKELSDNPAVQERMPGYRAKMGFGLHYGYAYEGAIGSNLKIDASYLSPDVKMAERLEAGTKLYGVLILMTEMFFDSCSEKVQQLLRKLDRVTANGITMELYTYDIDVAV